MKTCEGLSQISIKGREEDHNMENIIKNIEIFKDKYEKNQKLVE